MPRYIVQGTALIYMEVEASDEYEAQIQVAEEVATNIGNYLDDLEATEIDEDY